MQRIRKHKFILYVVLFLDGRKLTNLFSLTWPLENVSDTKECLRLGCSQRLHISYSSVLDIHCSTPRWLDHLPRTFPPPDPLLFRPSRCNSDFPTNRHHPPHMGPAILRSPRITFIHYAVNTFPISYGRD